MYLVVLGALSPSVNIFKNGHTLRSVRLFFAHITLTIFNSSYEQTQRNRYTSTNTKVPANTSRRKKEAEADLRSKGANKRARNAGYITNYRELKIACFRGLLRLTRSVPNRVIRPSSAVISRTIPGLGGSFGMASTR